MLETNVRNFLEKYGNKLGFGLLGTCLIVLLAIGLAYNLSGEETDKNEKPVQNESAETVQQSQNLTKYQEVFVDCPTKYLDACTEMSKQGTEKVEFLKSENNTIYLGMQDNNTMVVRITDNNSKPTMIRIEETE